MIEKILLDYLNRELDVPVYMEKPSDKPSRYVLIEKTSGGIENYVNSATIVIQSYAESMYQAAFLNETIKKVMEGIIALDAVSKARLNSDDNYTDTSKKQYRYQAVYDVVY